jgi:hypothetical protein
MALSNVHARLKGTSSTMPKLNVGLRERFNYTTAIAPSQILANLPPTSLQGLGGEKTGSASPLRRGLGGGTTALKHPNIPSYI